jgi:hypothetical protein
MESCNTAMLMRIIEWFVGRKRSGLANDGGAISYPRHCLWLNRDRRNTYVSASCP